MNNRINTPHVILNGLCYSNNAEFARNPIARRAFQCQLSDWSGDRPALCDVVEFLFFIAVCGA